VEKLLLFSSEDKGVTTIGTLEIFVLIIHRTASSVIFVARVRPSENRLVLGLWREK
jgi:hypothetical protein